MPLDGIDATRRLAADLGKAGREALPRARQAVAKSIHDIEATVEELFATGQAPVDTGVLMGSVSSELLGNANTAIGRVGPTANYGGYVEFGTHKMRPRPYMGPATDAHEPAFHAAIQQIADQTL